MTPRSILILSFYYPPDLSAGSFRTHALVEALLAADPDLRIDVVTSSPNRYGSFSSAAPAESTTGRVRVRRVPIPAHRSGMIDQTRSFLTFMRTASRLTRHDRYDLIYATSSRLMTAALGRWISHRSKTPLYLDIRDIFVDTMAEVLPGLMARALHPVLASVERWTVDGAAHVNLVSAGFAPYFADRYSEHSFSFFTNGVDDEFIRAPSSNGRQSRSPARIVYAGNIGDGQGLHAIIPQLAQRLAGRATFRLIGDGGRRAQLERAIADAGAPNVELLPPMQRDALIKEYLDADVLFLHLNDYEAFKKVLPSKLFEYAALGKPIWAGVAGYAADFLRKEVSNVAVFEPCNADDAIEVFEHLAVRHTPREEFVNRFSRRAIMRSMADNVLSFAKPRRTT